MSRPVFVATSLCYTEQALCIKYSPSLLVSRIEKLREKLYPLLVAEWLAEFKYPDAAGDPPSYGDLWLAARNRPNSHDTHPEVWVVENCRVRPYYTATPLLHCPAPITLPGTVTILPHRHAPITVSSILGVIYGVLLWAAMNAATPLGGGAGAGLT